MTVQTESSTTAVCATAKRTDEINDHVHELENHFLESLISKTCAADELHSRFAGQIRHTSLSQRLMSHSVAHFLFTTLLKLSHHQNHCGS